MPAPIQFHRHIRSEHQASGGGLGRPRPGGNPAQGFVGAAIHIPHPAKILAERNAQRHGQLVPHPTLQQTFLTPKPILPVAAGAASSAIATGLG